MIRHVSKHLDCNSIGRSAAPHCNYHKVNLGNLYTEFAMAVAARRDGVTPPADWLDYPTVEHGAQGVRFVDAAVESHKAGGAWVDCRLKL